MRGRVFVVHTCSRWHAAEQNVDARLLNGEPHALHRFGARLRPALEQETEQYVLGLASVPRTGSPHTGHGATVFGERQMLRFLGMVVGGQGLEPRTLGM